MSSQRPSEVGKRNLRGNAWVSFLGFGSIRAELNPRKLQRGRATGGAEFDTDGGHGGQRASASTGPRHGGRGIRLPARCRCAAPGLQRGRATGGAEFKQARGAESSHQGFNGAAPRGARNSAREWRDVRGHRALQRGRATGGAELESQTCCKYSADWLQRGRATGGAEFWRVRRVV